MRSNLFIVAALAAMGGVNLSIPSKPKISLRGKTDEEVREMILSRCKHDDVPSPSLAAGDMLMEMATHDDAERLTKIALDMPHSVTL